MGRTVAKVAARSEGVLLDEVEALDVLPAVAALNEHFKTCIFVGDENQKFERRGPFVLLQSGAFRNFFWKVRAALRVGPLCIRAKRGRFVIFPVLRLLGFGYSALKSYFFTPFSCRFRGSEERDPCF